MNAPPERLEFAPPATPGLLRALLLAILAHGLLVAALTWGVQWRRDAQQVNAEAELWAALPQEAAPAEPLPASVMPAPIKPLPLSQPVVAPPKADIMLERQKQLELATKAKLTQEQKKAAQQAKLLEQQRQQNLLRMTGMAGASGSSNTRSSANASGSAPKSAGASANYAGRIRASIKPNIVFTEELQGNPTAEVEVRAAPDGTIVGRKITRSSGVKRWDDAVIKAIDKTRVLPRDVDGSIQPRLLLVFRPKD